MCFGLKDGASYVKVLVNSRELGCCLRVAAGKEDGKLDGPFIDNW